MTRLPRSLLLPDEGVFHVTTRGAGQVTIFRDDSDRLSFLALFARVVVRFGWLVHAFTLMGNHYHLVVDTTRERLSGGMQRLNGDYAEGFNTRHQRTGHLFGDRFAARAIGDEEDLAGVCLYVVYNPVRAGLREEAEDWRWSVCRYGFDDF